MKHCKWMVFVAFLGLLGLFTNTFVESLDKDVLIKDSFVKVPEEWLIRDSIFFTRNTIYSENFNSGLNLAQLGFTGTLPTYWTLDTGNKNMASVCPGSASSSIYSPQFKASRATANVVVAWTVLPAGTRAESTGTQFPIRTLKPVRTIALPTPVPPGSSFDFSKPGVSGLVALSGPKNNFTYGLVYEPSTNAKLPGIRVSVVKAGQSGALGSAVIPFNQFKATQFNFMMKLNAVSGGSGAGDIAVYYSRGGIFTVYTKCLTVHDDTYTEFTNLRFEYQRNIKAPEVQIAIDNVRVIGAGDVTAPVTSHNYADNGKWVNHPVTINLTATDTGGSGVAQTHYRIDGGLNQDGTVININTDGVHPVEFWSEDNAGNVETPHKTLSVKIDRIAPVTQANPNPGPNTAGWNKEPVNVTFVATDTGGSAVKETHYKVNGGGEQIGNSVSFTSDGTYSIQYWSVDQAGNVETPLKSITVKIDRAFPVTQTGLTPAPNAAGWNNTSSIKVNFAAADSGSLIKETHYQVDGGADTTGDTVNINAEGSHEVKYWSVDQADNVEAPKILMVKLDKTAPVTEANLAPGPNAAGWSNGSVDIDLAAVDGCSGIKEIHYQIDGGADTIGNTVNINMEGSHTVQYWSVDQAGNVEIPHKSVTVKIDLTAPQTQANYPAPGATGWYGSNVTVNFTATDGGSGTKETRYKVNGGTEQIGTSVNINTNGVNTLEYWTIDQAGNVEMPHKTITINVDQAAPVTAANQTPAANAAGWNNTSPVTVNFSATDSGSGLKETHYRVGSAAEQIGNSVNISVEGTQEVQYWSVDQAGQVETPHKTITVKLDLTAPVIANLQPANGATVTGPMVNISAKLSDSLSAINPGSVQILIDGTDNTASATVITGADGSLTYRLLKSLTGGSHQVVVKATDYAGKQAQASWSFVVN